MKKINIFRILVTVVFFITSIGYAKNLEQNDIFVSTNNNDYEVSKVTIHRIAAENSNKFLCQKLHWLMKFYWSPREWYSDLNFEETGDGEFETTVKPNYLQNSVCGSSLISALKVTIFDTINDKEFNLDTYLYTNGDETILLRAIITYDQGDWESIPSHKVTIKEVDRYMGEDNNFIDLEIIDNSDAE